MKIIAFKISSGLLFSAFTLPVSKELLTGSSGSTLQIVGDLQGITPLPAAPVM